MSLSLSSKWVQFWPPPSFYFLIGLTSRYATLIIVINPSKHSFYCLTHQLRNVHISKLLISFKKHVLFM